MSESIWKKEIHLRKPKEPKAQKAAPVESPKPATSFWKKERHVRTPPAPLPPLPERLLQAHREETPRGMVVVPVLPPREPEWPTIDAPVVALHEEIVEEPYEAPDAEQTLDLPLPDPWEAPAEGPELELVPPAGPAGESVGDLLRRYAIATERVPEPEPEVEVIEPAVVEAEVAEPEVVEPEPLVATVAVEAVPEEKAPLLKREIHFRKPKAPKEPKPAKAPKAKKQPKPEKQPKAPKVEKTAKPPLLKREFQMRRPKRAEKPESVPKAHKVTRVVGLRIGSSQLSAAHIRNNGSAELVQLARSPIERGLVVGGEVRDAEGLSHALKDFFNKNKLPRKDVRLGVASNRIGVRILDVPFVEDAKQFQNALRFRAQELLPIPVVDAIIDHVIIGESTNDEGEAMRKVLLVFAHRELVSRYVDVCRTAGVRLVGIDLEPFALLRAIAPPASGDSAVVAVAIGNERTIMAVSDGRICDFVRVLDWGGSSIDVALAHALDLAPSQAEPLKRDLMTDGAETELTPVQLELARNAVRTEISVLGRELVSSLRFYQSRSDSLAIGEVVITGGTAELTGIAEELQRHLGAAVRVADPLARVQLPKKFNRPADVGSLAVAVGLGIED